MRLNEYGPVIAMVVAVSTNGCHQEAPAVHAPRQVSGPGNPFGGGAEYFPCSDPADCGQINANAATDITIGTISRQGRSVRRSTTRFGMVGLPAGDVRLDQTFEMGPQSFEGRQHRSKVFGRQSLDPPGLVGDTGDLIQIPSDRAQRAGGVPELGELPIGKRWRSAQVSANQHRDVGRRRQSTTGSACTK